MRNIFFDFDGTLIDSRIRLYVLFKQLALSIVPDCAGKILEFDAYWQRRRLAVLQVEILQNMLNFSASETAEFRKLWMEQIEDDKLLALDTPFSGLTDSLGKLTDKCNLYLATARQHPEKVEKQLVSFGWKHLFTSVFVTEQRTNKADLIRQHGIITSPDDIFFGDTAEDIKAAQTLGIKSVAVDSGFVGLEVLHKYHPWQSYKSVCEALSDGCTSL